MGNNPSLNDNRGMTLLETVIATAIGSSILTLGFSGASVIMDSQKKSIVRTGEIATLRALIQHTISRKDVLDGHPSQDLANCLNGKNCVFNQRKDIELLLSGKSTILAGTTSNPAYFKVTGQPCIFGNPGCTIRSIGEFTAICNPGNTCTSMPDFIHLKVVLSELKENGTYASLSTVDSIYQVDNGTQLDALNCGAPTVHTHADVDDNGNVVTRVEAYPKILAGVQKGQPLCYTQDAKFAPAGQPGPDGIVGPEGPQGDMGPPGAKGPGCYKLGGSYNWHCAI